VRETTSLKATEEPMLIRPRRMERTVVVKTAVMGIFVLPSTL